MKRFIILMSALTLLGMNLCAQSHKARLSTTEGKRMDRYTFGEKPIYKMRVEGAGSPVIILINGVEVYKNVTGEHYFYLVTVNDYIINGENRIGLKLLDEPKLDRHAKATLTLEVTSSKSGKRYILSRLSYDLSKKNPSEGSSGLGFYRFDDEKGMVLDADGELFIGKVESKPFDIYRRESVEGISITQRVAVPAPYPRWRFLDSQDIIDKTYDYISEEEHARLKNSPKIKALYALDAKLRQALREKNPQKIIDLFEERNQELAIASYDSYINIKTGLLRSIMNDVNDPNSKLVEHKGDDLYFVIEENRKLAWIRPISFFDKSTGLYSIYNIKYRLNKRGEWVITR